MTNYTPGAYFGVDVGGDEGCADVQRWGRAVSVVRVFALPGMFLRGCR